MLSVGGSLNSYAVRVEETAPVQLRGTHRYADAREIVQTIRNYEEASSNVLHTREQGIQEYTIEMSRKLLTSGRVWTENRTYNILEEGGGEASLITLDEDEEDIPDLIDMRVKDRFLYGSLAYPCDYPNYPVSTFFVEKVQVNALIGACQNLYNRYKDKWKPVDLQRFREAIRSISDHQMRSLTASFPSSDVLQNAQTDLLEKVLSGNTVDTKPIWDNILQELERYPYEYMGQFEDHVMNNTEVKHITSVWKRFFHMFFKGIVSINRGETPPCIGRTLVSRNLIGGDAS